VAVQKNETSPIRPVDEPESNKTSAADGGSVNLTERLPQIVGDFDAFTAALKRQRRVLAASILAVTAALGLLLATQTPLYESTALLLVKFGREVMYQPEVGESPQAFTQRDKQAVLNSELAILLSQPVMEGVARDVGLPRLYSDLGEREADLQAANSEAADPELSDHLYAEAAVRLALSLTAQALPEAHVLRISFRHSDPTVAASAVNAAVEHFTEKHLEAFGEPELVLFLTRRVENYREALRETEMALREFETEHRAFALDDPQGVLLQRRDETNREIVELERQISSLRSGALQEVSAISEARRELLTLELERSRVRGKLRDEVSKRINVVESFIAERQSERAQEVILLKKKWGSLDEQRQRLDQDLSDHPMLSARYRELRRERDATEEQYLTYSKRLREARLSHEMDGEKLASINVIQPAFPAATPIWPRGYLLSGAIVLVVAVVIGMLAATACEAFSIRLPGWLRSTDTASGPS
jgi:uncharacterized protein involved in exopolysaccharide biosynthesis